MTLARGHATLGVVRAGIMGTGITQASVLAGIPVVPVDPVTDARTQAFDRIIGDLPHGRIRGRSEADDDHVVQSLQTGTSQIDDLATCDVVVEAVPKDLEIERAALSDIESVFGSETVIASNTPPIPITSLVAAAKRLTHVVGMNLLTPAPSMRLIEVVATQPSAPTSVLWAAQIRRLFGKRVVAPNGPGFPVNRCHRVYYGEPIRILPERSEHREERYRAAPFLIAAAHDGTVARGAA